MICEDFELRLIMNIHVIHYIYSTSIVLSHGTDSKDSSTSRTKTEHQHPNTSRTETSPWRAPMH